MGQDDETPVIELIDGKEPYLAYDRTCPDRPGKCYALDIVDRGHFVETVMYGYILRQRFTVPCLISLICADAAVLIAGRSLDLIQELIKDRRLSELHVYNPAYHREPPEGVPVIEKVIVEPRRPYQDT